MNLVLKGWSTDKEQGLKAADEAVKMFVKEDLLEGSGNFFATTEKGEFFIEHLLHIPFPQTSYSIPKEKTSWYFTRQSMVTYMTMDSKRKRIITRVGIWQ